MSPTVMRIRDLRFIIYPKDHLPAHVHVLDREGHEAKFRIDDGVCYQNHGFTERAVRELERTIQGRKEMFWEMWNDWQD